MAKKKQTPQATTPTEFTGISIKKTKDMAAGAPAIISSLKHLKDYTDPAQSVKTMFKLNQKGGFDCPGCAWPDPDDERSSLGEYCENGAKAIAEEIQKKTIGAEFFSEHSVYDLSLLSDFEIGKQGRLIEPMVLKKGGDHYEPITWDKAFKLIAKEIRGLDHPDEALFYTSGRTSNEAAFLYQLFARTLGTNNLPDCSNMCHESSGIGLSETLGIGKGSVTLQDLHEAEVIMVMGQNPGTNHPRMLTALQKCKNNGGRIISVNPLPEAGLMRFAHPQKPAQMLRKGTKLTDLFLQVKINGDVALLQAIMKLLLIEEEKTPGKIFDLTFIKEHTEGYKALLKALKKLDLDKAVKASGVSLDDIKTAVNMLKHKQKIIICWAMGLTQHVNGVANIQEIVNLLLLKGAIGKPGAGTCPVRGHSNVQGDRTMGVWESPKDSFLDKLDEVFDIKSPRKHGHAVVDAIEAMHKEEAKIFFGLGGNFISASPDTEYTAEAMRKCSLTVHVSTKLNRSHLVHGQQALILPCLGRTDIDEQQSGEQFISVENSMGVVHSSRGVLTPPSELLKSEIDIVASLAHHCLPDSAIDWLSYIDNYDLIRDAVEQVVPGFDNYNGRVRLDAGFYLPNGARDREFNTDNGKAKFTIHQIPKTDMKGHEFIMMTIRSHDQYNTTIYGLDDRYRGIYNERRVVMMNETDMAMKKLIKGDVVDIAHDDGHHKRTAPEFIVVPYDIPRGCVATYFPEANVLVPLKHMAIKSKTPASKNIPVNLI